MDKAVSGFVEIMTLIISVAIVAVLVSKKAQTSSIITSAGDALSKLLGEAVSPVTGASSSFENPFE